MRGVAPMSVSQSCFRVYSFVCGDMPYEFAVDFDPRLSGQEQETSLQKKFRRLLDTVLPGCEEAGGIDRLAFADHVHPAVPAVPCGRIHRCHGVKAA